MTPPVNRRHHEIACLIFYECPDQPEEEPEASSSEDRHRGEGTSGCTPNLQRGARYKRDGLFDTLVGIGLLRNGPATWGLAGIKTCFVFFSISSVVVVTEKAIKCKLL
jgi:hypothetical protein|mmetsp:Transcript_107218/g.181158  ORF Transcript_107218/g.181158 Transcript_107218/m.181158 type:complete len:108 (-) Transcript_107218:658-981(-)